VTRSDRSVSTVLDVAVALVLISASVTLLFVFVAQDDAQPVPVEADRTAETLVATTASPQYTLEPAVDHAEDGIFRTEDAGEFERTEYGTTLGLLGDVTVINASFWGKEYSRAGVELEESVEGATLSEISRMDHDVRLEAVWRPYEGSGIEGSAGVGQSVPPNEDVSSVTMTVSSGFDDVSDDIRDTDADIDDAANLIAHEIVAGLLPPEETQRELESSGISRDLAHYHYNRLSKVMKEINDTYGSEWDEEDFHDPQWEVEYPYHPDDVLDEPNERHALWLNHYLVEQTLANRVADDLEEVFGKDVTADELAAAVSIDQVQITVRTWGTHE